MKTKAAHRSIGPAIAFGTTLLLAGMTSMISAHAQSTTTAMSHSTKKDAGAAARHQTAMSGHKRTLKRTSHSRTHATSSHMKRRSHVSKTMGHKTAHQNQAVGATSKAP
ncbi:MULTISPECIES: hypothetical protein [Acidiphilium]|uniref:Pentapeptide MXKDX repeat protein n=1 Tax=Acidiphilium rubrum TaxID=526 RepID=A0A8G2CKH2_ACIRU|nr:MULTISPECIES: hypothetical protein [Acidiphilium]SIQ77131.1 hypothetical protein SAMN05421828_10942 [Acidiphilium rubrum]